MNVQAHKYWWLFEATEDGSIFYGWTIAEWEQSNCLWRYLFVCFSLHTMYTHLIVFCSCVYSYFSSCIQVIMCNNNLRVKFTFLYCVNLTYKGMSMRACWFNIQGYEHACWFNIQGDSMRALSTHLNLTHVYGVLFEGTIKWHANAC